MISGFRIGAGTFTVATFTESYAIESLPVQSDMSGYGWAAPNKRGGGIVPAAVVLGLDGSLSNDGDEVVKWFLPWATPGMVSYLYTTIFSSAPSVTMTIRDYDEQTGAFRVLNCTAHWPKPAELRALTWYANGSYGAMGCENFPLTFIKCKDAEAS